jgi:hypothetical protein
MSSRWCPAHHVVAVVTLHTDQGTTRSNFVANGTRL